MITNAKIINVNVASAVYLRQDVARGDGKYVIGRSDLCEIASNPYKWVNSKDDESNDAMIWGSLVDATLFGVDLNNIAVTPAAYVDDKKVSKPWNWNANVCKDWREAHKGKMIVKPDTMIKVTNAVNKIRQDAQIKALLNCSRFQAKVEASYLDDATGLVVPLKGLIDIAPNKDNAEFGNKLVDLKTTFDASPFQWGRGVFSGNYHVQAAFYLDLWNAATCEHRDSFLHIVQESEEPYMVCKRRLSDEYLKLGRAQYLAALKKYCTCLKNNEWTGYDESRIIDGWALTEPEPWMILRAGVEVEPTDNTKNW